MGRSPEPRALQVLCTGYSCKLILPLIGPRGIHEQGPKRRVMVRDGNGVVFQLEARAHEVGPDVIRVGDGDVNRVVLLNQFADGAGIGSVFLLKADGLIEHPSERADFVLVGLIGKEAGPVLLFDPSGGVLKGQDSRRGKGEGPGKQRA